jgi:heme A synthase
VPTERDLRLPCLLTVAFGTTVSMWAAGYVSRLPAVQLPAPALLPLLLACILGGGFVVGRWAGLGWRHGALAGALTGVLNLLVLGAVLARRSDAVLWLPGSIVLAAALAALGAAVGVRRPRRPPYEAWVGAFARVAVAAALLLLGVGGLVTSTGAGLAVVDWPNSYGSNMFLYPLSRMTGAIYYEHAHRLFGALVGLTTLALAILLSLREPRRWVRALGWTAFAMVVIQGMLGGLRVTGRFTLSTAAADMRPSLVLAAIHGIFGQLFFAVLVTLAVVTATAWREEPQARKHRGGRADRLLVGALLGLLLAQLTLGSMQRHFSSLLIAHIALGIGFVAPLAVHVGFRTWARHPDRPRLGRLGLTLIVAVALQVALGLGAFATTGGADAPLEIVVTTAHQWFGAVLLGLAVSLACWTFRVSTQGFKS